MNPIASHFGSWAQERQNVVHVEHVIEIPVPQTVEDALCADCAGPLGKALSSRIAVESVITHMLILMLHGAGIFT